MCADSQTASAETHSLAVKRFVSRSMVRSLLRLVVRRLAWVTAAGEGAVPDHHRCVDSEAELHCRDFLDSLAGAGGAGPSTSSRRLDRLGLRSGPAVVWHPVLTCSWIMPRRPSGHLYRRIAAQRVRAAAVTRMYQRGRPAPLPGIRVNGGVVEVASGSEPVACGHRRQKAGSGLEVAAEAVDPGHAGKFGG